MLYCCNNATGRMRRFFWVMFLLISSATSYAQVPTPIIDCVEIDEFGSTISWMPGTDGSVSCGASFDAYHIYVSSTPEGPFTLLFSTANDESINQYLDTNNEATSANPFYYYVQAECAGVLSAPSDTIDTGFPIAPELIVVTVSAAGTSPETYYPVLSWNVSVSPQTDGYIIYRSEGSGSFLPIDTIFDPTVTSYIDLNADGSSQSVSYVIAAYDCTGEPGANNGIPHSTLFASADVDDCGTEAITVNWNAYVPWAGTLSYYEVWVDVLEDGLAPAPTEIAAGTTTWSYTLPEGFSEVCFEIRAVSTVSIQPSVSNEVCISVNDTQGPAYMYLTNLTVVDNTSILSEWTIDPNSPLTTFSVNRGETDSLNLSNYAPINTPVAGTTAISYTDSDNLATHQFSYVYQLQHDDECGRSGYSTVGNTILLDGNAKFNFTNALDWSAFALTFAEVESYTLYRRDNNSTAFTEVATFDANTFEYEDALEGVGSLATEYCYYVTATYVLDIPGLDVNITSTSKSNELCIPLTARLHMPNAFAPNGINNIFKPVIVFPNYDNYSMIIMNRWGEIVYSTTNPDEGWNGEYKGQLAAQGVYTYVVKMLGQSGYNYERKGTLMLVR